MTIFDVINQPADWTYNFWLSFVGHLFASIVPHQFINYIVYRFLLLK